MQYLAIIPARGGSKGVPRKNLLPIYGRPLIAWSIGQALATPGIDRVIVSTDDEEIADVARSCGAEVPWLRPQVLAQDATPTESVLIDVVTRFEAEGYFPDAVVLLQPTSPLRRPISIPGAMRQFEEEGADSLLSVCESHAFFWKLAPTPEALYDFRNRPRRQDIADRDRRYRENGSIYLTKRKILLSEGNRLGGRISVFKMAEEESWEIDSLADFQIVETLMKEGSFV